ncbi:PcfK-like family protein [Bacteroides reticulotermitis]|uniref:PcfK-like family protein n=1 Tax=Bacteroides reticulotermitis TaxID=1133319 RepID=UPI003A8BF02E
MKPTNSFQEVIKSYLDRRAETDELFAVSYAKKHKSINECCDYIMGEAKKRGSAVAISDEEVFGMAVHYYDEDDIKINKVSGRSRVSAPAPKAEPKVKLTEKEKKAAREAAIKRLTEEQYTSIKKRPSKKKEDDVQQMSLF